MQSIGGTMNTEQTKRECANPWLCSFLGFFLPLVGLIVSAIIGKGEGVKHCLSGIAFRYILIIGGCIFFARKAAEIADEAKYMPDPAPRRSTSRPSEPGKTITWTYTRKPDSINDGYIYIAGRDSTLPVHRDEYATLYIRREADERSVYIAWPSYVGSSTKSVTIRFDSDEAVTDDWECSQSGRAIFSPFPFEDIFPLILDSKTLVVRLTPADGYTATVKFDISGLAGILPKEAIAAFKGE